MTTTNPSPIITFLKPFLLLLPFSFLLIFLFHSTTNHTPLSPTSPTYTPGLRIRPGYRTYDEYITRQLKKTQNPDLRRLWLTRDWDRKVRVFAGFFRELQSEGLLPNASRALCVGARVGQEVAALRLVGVADSVGIDLVPHPPLVVGGDFHRQPFGDGSFDFEFSNVFDHALYPDRFVGEIERTLRPGGVAVLQVALRRKGDKYSANDLYSVGALVGLFRKSELVRVRKVDGFGLDTEVVLRKRKEKGEVQRRSRERRSS